MRRLLMWNCCPIHVAWKSFGTTGKNFSATSQNESICNRNSRLHGFFKIADLKNQEKLTGRYR